MNISQILGLYLLMQTMMLTHQPSPVSFGVWCLLMVAFNIALLFDKKD